MRIVLAYVVTLTTLAMILVMALAIYSGGSVDSPQERGAVRTVTLHRVISV